MFSSIIKESEDNYLIIDAYYGGKWESDKKSTIMYLELLDWLRKHKTRKIEKARETLVNAMFDYAKVLGLDLDIKDCSSIISDVTTDFKELEKFVDEMLSSKEKSKCNKREKRTVISDAEADEILKLVKEFFN